MSFSTWSGSSGLQGRRQPHQLPQRLPTARFPRRDGGHRSASRSQECGAHRTHSSVRGYGARPTVRAMTSTQGPLSRLRLASKQASILPPPGCMSPHIALISPRHSFAIAAAPVRTARHRWVRSAKCELRHDLIAPPPAGTSPHAALISAAHSAMTACCWAIAAFVESNMTVPIANTVFSIGCTLDGRSPSFVPS